MRIMLIRPPEPRTAKSGSVVHPLGIGYIASVLEKHNFDVEIIDCQAYQNSWDSDKIWDFFKDKLKNFKPDVIGITCKTTFFPNAVKAASITKKILPECTVIAGGPHITALPEQSLSQNPSIDLAVYGEGEYAMVDLCRAIDDGRTYEDIQSIIYRDGEEIIQTEPRPLPEDLDAIPFPAYHLMPMERYFLSTAKNSAFASLMASRGCPFKCKFCSSRQIHGTKTRRRSVDNVIEEILLLKGKYGTKDIIFMDDTFTANPTWVMEFCDRLIEDKIDIVWQCQTRVNTVNRELLKKMKESGCYMTNYGVEFGSQRILDLAGKGITNPQVRTAFKLTKEIGIRTYAYFMMGWPGETKEEIKQTITLAKELNPDFAQFSIVVPFPGSPLYDECMNNGYIDVIHWDEFDYAYNPVIRTDGLNTKEVRRLYKKAYREFYLRPTYILHKILNLRSANEFKDTIIGGLSFLKFLTAYESEKK